MFCDYVHYLMIMFQLIFSHYFGNISFISFYDLSFECFIVY